MKRNKRSDWCVLSKSVLGGIGLGLAGYVILLVIAYILGV